MATKGDGQTRWTKTPDKQHGCLKSESAGGSEGKLVEHGRFEEPAHHRPNALIMTLALAV